MKKIIIGCLLLVSQITFASSIDVHDQVRNSLIKASWSVDGLDYAVKNQKSAAACQSLGVIQFIIRDLKERTVNGSVRTGSYVKSMKIKRIIGTLPHSSTVCAGVATLTQEKMLSLDNLRKVLRTKIESALVYF